jgi:hypothetical protein
MFCGFIGFQPSGSAQGDVYSAGHAIGEVAMGRRVKPTKGNRANRIHGVKSAWRRLCNRLLNPDRPKPKITLATRAERFW